MCNKYHSMSAINEENHINVCLSACRLQVKITLLIQSDNMRRTDARSAFVNKANTKNVGKGTTGNHASNYTVDHQSTEALISSMRNTQKINKKPFALIQLRRAKEKIHINQVYVIEFSNASTRN